MDLQVGGRVGTFQRLRNLKGLIIDFLVVTNNFLDADCFTYKVFILFMLICTKFPVFDLVSASSRQLIPTRNYMQ